MGSRGRDENETHTTAHGSTPAPRWAFPHPDTADESGLVAVGGDLEPDTLRDAYGHGLFPMPVRRAGPIGWWSPDPRGILPLDSLRLTRSLRRSLKRYEVTVDHAFGQIVEACADPSRPHGWIDERITSAYRNLHDLGVAHSIECWQDDRLVGGLYGVAYGGLFAGESMFSHETDASKVALVHLVDVLRTDGRPRLLDVQWCTAHLATLGAVEIPRTEYLHLLAAALALPDPFS